MRTHDPNLRRPGVTFLMTVLSLPFAAEPARGEVRTLEEARVVASDGQGGEVFADAIAVDRDVLLVGAISDDDLGERSGSGYVFERSPADGRWVEVRKLLASDGQAGDLLGDNAAVEGSVAVLGATQTFRAGFNPGAAYVFERDRGGPRRWGEAARLTAADGTAGDGFGISVAIDRGRIAVGASRDDDRAPGAGSAYVFEPSPSGGWEQIAKLVAPDAAAGDGFGLSVGISGDAVVVGAPLASGTGVAYVFERTTDGRWGLAARLVAADARPGDSFGLAVAISGTTAIVGAPLAAAPLPATGAAYAFERVDGRWSQTARLTAPDGAPGDLLGWALEIDRDTAAVGAWMDDVDGVDSAGSVHLFQRDVGGVDAWGPVARLVASDGADGDIFGETVGLRDDLVAVGAALADAGGIDSGAGYLFRVQPEASLTGSCPGTTVLSVAGASPGGSIGWVGGSATGETTVPSGRCAGARLELLAPAPIGTTESDSGGRSERPLELPAVACGRAVQAIDATTCATTPVIVLPHSP